MASDLYLFLKDRLHITATGPVLTASDTVSGYAIDNVREADLVKAWKGGDSTTADKWLQVDGNSNDWVGTAGQTAFAVVAWDNRGGDQDTIKLITDDGDEATFSPPNTTLATWTISAQKSEITMEWKSFTIQTPSKRYYRLIQYGNERTEAGGSITSKILCWGMYNATDVIRLSVNFPGDAEADHSVNPIDRVAVARTAGGQSLTNAWAENGHRFTVSFAPASDALFRRLRDDLFTIKGRNRAFFVLKNGLRNSALANFFLCRLVGAEWNASQRYVDQYDVSLEFETEPWL